VPIEEDPIKGILAIDHALELKTRIGTPQIKVFKSLRSISTAVSEHLKKSTSEIVSNARGTPVPTTSAGSTSSAPSGASGSSNIHSVAGFADYVVKNSAENAGEQGVTDFLSDANQGQVLDILRIRCLFSNPSDDGYSVDDTTFEGMLLGLCFEDTDAQKFSQSRKTGHKAMFSGRNEVDASVESGVSVEDYLKARISDIFDEIGVRRIDILMNANEQHAHIEEFHMKISYMTAHTLRMVHDVVDCLHFLMDNFGCDRWAKHSDPVKNVNMGEHDMCEPLVLNTLVMENLIEQVYADAIFSRWKGAAKRSPFEHAVVECWSYITTLLTKKSHRQNLLGTFRQPVDKNLYIQDVSVIRQILAYTLKNTMSLKQARFDKTKKQNKDAEEDTGKKSETIFTDDESNVRMCFFCVFVMRAM
jgi:hypothetical protein